MPSKSDNIRELRRLSSDFKAKVAVNAVKAGQAVILAGLQRRCPVGETHRLYRSIHSTRVGVGPHSAGGGVVVGTDHAYAVEFGPHARPFVRPTRLQDGPKAERAMAAVIEGSRNV